MFTPDPDRLTRHGWGPPPARPTAPLALWALLAQASLPAEYEITAGEEHRATLPEWSRENASSTAADARPGAG